MLTYIVTVLTIVSVLWSRVELQALKYQPWVAHSQEKQAAKRDRTYILDYTSLLPPTVIVHSLRNRAYSVFLVSIVSLIIKVQIALAPGLFSSASVVGSQPVDVRVLDLFNTSVTYLDEDTTAYYALQVFRNFDMRYPFGLTQSAAYQTFGIEDQSSRGTIDAPLEVVVDGFFSDMKCFKLKNHNVTGVVDRGDSYLITTELRFENCELTIEQPLSITKKQVTGDFFGKWISRDLFRSTAPCKNLPQHNPQQLYCGMRFEIPPGHEPILRDIAAILCGSMSWISSVKVLDDGINPTVTTLPHDTKTDISMDLWHLIRTIVPPTASDWGSWGGPVQTNFSLSQNKDYTALENDPSFYRNDVLYDAAMNMSRLLGPWAGHYRLREHLAGSYSQITGFKATEIDKFLVNTWVCLLMTGLFIILTLSTLVLLLRYRQATIFNWYRDPGTVLGNMLFFQDNKDVGVRVSSIASRFPPKDGNTDWNKCSYTPFALKTWARITFSAFVILTFTVLCCTIIISKSSDGIATITPNMEVSYWNLLWTSLPAIAMLSIALYVSSCDAAHRNLAVFSTLSQKQGTVIDLDMSFIDMLGLRSLYHSVAKRILAVTFSQVLVVLCGFLATLMSVVFTVRIIPHSQAVQIQQTSWFGSREIGYSDESRTRRTLVGSLVLRQGDAAITWPRNTYYDLIFPNISTANAILGDSRNTSITLTIPAAKLNSTCTKLSNLENSISFERGGETGTGFQVAFRESISCPNGSQATLQSTMSHSVMYAPKFSYVANIINSPGNRKDSRLACGGADDDNYSAYRYQTYVWGNFSWAKKDFEYMTTWRCKYTWIEIPTNISLTFVDGDYILDPKAPPRPDISNTRPWSPEFDIPHINSRFDDRKGNERNDSTEIGNVFPLVRLSFEDRYGHMSDEFNAILRPHGRVSIEVFGDANQEVEILKELNHNYAAFAAQLANLENRFSVNESSRTGPLPSGSLPDVVGTFTDRGRRRLVQNAPVTYVILGILGLVIVIHVSALLLNIFQRVGGETWIFDMEVEGLAPDGLHSIAAAVSLLKDSNASKFLPEGAHLLSSDELHGQLADLRFQMGWFQDADGNRKYTIGVLGDDEFKFLGKKKSVEKEDA